MKSKQRIILVLLLDMSSEELSSALHRSGVMPQLVALPHLLRVRSALYQLLLHVHLLLLLASVLVLVLAP
jgi:hypothetical protein